CLHGRSPFDIAVTLLIRTSRTLRCQIKESVGVRFSGQRSRRTVPLGRLRLDFHSRPAPHPADMLLGGKHGIAGSFERPEPIALCPQLGTSLRRIGDPLLIGDQGIPGPALNTNGRAGPGVFGGTDLAPAPMTRRVPAHAILTEMGLSVLGGF